MSEGAPSYSSMGPKTRKRSPRQEISSEESEWHTPWLDSLPMTEYEIKEQRLHDEIVAFVSYMSPSTQEIRARDLVMSVIQGVVKRRFATCVVAIYGSVAYGLSLPSGDLDVVIETPEVYAKNYLVRTLFQLSSMFKNAGITTNCLVIPHAKVPILKLETLHTLGSVQFDINVNSVDGLRAVPVIKSYLEEMPALRPLVLVIKTFLAKNGLHSAATGGLGSYATICLVIGFLKINQRNCDPESTQRPLECEALGTLLLEFFDFFGNNFPYDTSYISPTEGKVLPKEQKGWMDHRRLGALAIECLVDPLNDVGKSAQKVRKIRAAFQEAYQTLQSYQLSLEHGNILGSILGVSQKTLSYRHQIRELVDSGALEKTVASVVLPPSREPPKRQSSDRRPWKSHRDFYHGRAAVSSSNYYTDSRQCSSKDPGTGYYTRPQDTPIYDRSSASRGSRDHQTKRRRV